jgi:hypothetical protein
MADSMDLCSQFTNQETDDKILHYFLNCKCPRFYVSSFDLSFLDFHVWGPYERKIIGPYERKIIKTQSRHKMKIFYVGIQANVFVVLGMITHSIEK